MPIKNVLVLTYWSYKDALVQSATMPYVRMIRRQLPVDGKVFLLTLEQSARQMSDEEAHRISGELRREGIYLLRLNHSKFGLKAAAKWMLFIPRLAVLCVKERISSIHAWCTPAGAAGYMLSKLTGIPLVIDSYEPHAESMVENGAWRADSAAFKILFALERLQSHRARAVIATTGGVKAYAAERYGVAFERFYIKPACVDLDKFSACRTKDAALAERYKLCDKIVCVYAGKIGGIYLDDEIFDFFKVASDYWGDKFRALLLTNADEEMLKKQIARSRLDPHVVIARFVEHDDVPRHLGLGDFAINPVKPVPTKRYCTSIKDGEYWAMGLPVVIPPNISDDSDIIRDNKIGSIIKSFDSESYLRSINEIDALLKSCPKHELSEKIRRVAVKYRNLRDAEEIYKELYGSRESGALHMKSK